VQQYGFSSHPHAGAECFVVFAGAGRDHPLVFSVDDRRFRVRASEPGEVVLYTDEGDTIRMKRGNRIEVETKHLAATAEEDAEIATRKAVVKATDEYVLETAHLKWRIGAWSVESLEGEGPVTATVRMNLDQEGWHRSTGDQVAGAVSQVHHVHAGVQPGGGTSGEPQGQP
jgi:phage baseplate assembly protein V